MEKLMAKSIKKVDGVKTDFKRFLFDKINPDRRLTGIKGARGTGKTTLMLQYIKGNFGLTDEALYVSLDNIYFTENKLVDLADEFVKSGGKYLFLDEVHKYPHWSREIKNIYDDYSGLKIFFTGSSILEIDKGEADLSRRAKVYELPILSLREFVEISYGIKFRVFSLREIIENHIEVARAINKKIKPVKEFNNYNHYGAYPFFLEAGQEDYPDHLERIVRLVLETDLPASVAIDYSSIVKLKQLLMIISESVPFQPNISKLSIKIGVTRETLLKFLYYLEKARLVALLKSGTKGLSKMAKPDKIYLHNANLSYALQPENTNIGTVRETFFYSQLLQGHHVAMPRKGDFIIDNKLVFEVGGKNKIKKQVAALKDAFVVSDNIEYGFKNKIPLWLFGFLY